MYETDRIRFAEKVLKAVKGEKGIVEPTFIYLSGVPGGDAIQKETGCDFFSVPVELGVSIISLPRATSLQTNIMPGQRCRKGSQPTHQHQRGREGPPQGCCRRSQGQHLQGSHLRSQPSSKVIAPLLFLFLFISNSSFSIEFSKSISQLSRVRCVSTGKNS
jgi:hypothetical protein